MPGRDTNIGAKRARETREELGLAPDAPATCLLTRVEEDLGLPVVLATLPDGIAGACLQTPDGIVLWVNGRQPPVRQRFTLAHELGHVRCCHEGGTAVDTVTILAGQTTEAREIQANAFAAEFLAPKAGVLAMLGRTSQPNLEDVVRIAARYGISSIAAFYRLRTLELVRRPQPLEEEVRDGLDKDVSDRLGLDQVEDAIGAIAGEDLPRLSPSIRDSAFGALIARRVTVVEAAAGAHVPPDDLRAALAAIEA